MNSKLYSVITSENHLIGLVEKIDKYTKTDPDSALILAEKGLIAAKSSDLDDERLSLYLRLSTLYFSKERYKIGVQIVLEGIEDRAHFGSDSLILSALYTNLGRYYKKLGEYNKALESYFKSLGIKRGRSDKVGTSATLNNIGTLYTQMGDDRSALNYHLEALNLRESIDFKRGVGSSLINMGGAYHNLGKLDSAILSFQKSLEIMKGIDYKIGIAKAYNNIGIVYKGDGKFEKALNYIMSALSLKEELGYHRSAANSKLNIGDLYISMGNYTQSHKFLTSAIEYGEEHKDLILLRLGYSFMAKLYAIENDYKNAYEYQKRYDEIKNQLISTEKSKDISRLQIIYETQKHTIENERLKDKTKIQQLEIEQTKSSNRYLVIITAFILFFFLYLLHLYRFNRKFSKLLKSKHDQLEEKNVALTNALEEVKQLNGLLPICSYCKNIRDDKGYWKEIEQYIRDHSDADFSHSICPDCIQKHFKNLKISGSNG